MSGYRDYQDVYDLAYQRARRDRLAREESDRAKLALAAELRANGAAYEQKQLSANDRIYAAAAARAQMKEEETGNGFKRMEAVRAEQQAERKAALEERRKQLEDDIYSQRQEGRASDRAREVEKAIQEQNNRRMMPSAREIDTKLEEFGRQALSRQRLFDMVKPEQAKERDAQRAAAEREKEARWYEQNAAAYGALDDGGKSAVERANETAARWDNMHMNLMPGMMDTSGLGMTVQQQMELVDAYKERQAATAALEQAAGENAKAVARYAEQMKNAEYAEAFAKDARQGADEHPVLHNAASVVSNALNLPAALDYGKQWARNTFTDDYAPIDVNTPEQLMGLYRDTVRDETGKNIEESLGGGFGGKAASFVYQTGMSWADSLANMAMSGGNAALSGVLMGSGAMASTVRSAKEKGASDSQAMGAGIAAGFFEGLFEQYSIENLSWMAKSDPRTFRDVVKNLGKSILGEGSEELFTELANIAADTLIMGDLSDYNLGVQQYIAQGASEKEAKQHAAADLAVQAGLAFAGGALMGMGSAGAGMTYNTASNRYTAPRAVESGEFYNALQYGLAQGEDTDAGRLARELAGKDTAGNADVMRMLREAYDQQEEDAERRAEPSVNALLRDAALKRTEIAQQEAAAEPDAHTDEAAARAAMQAAEAAQETRSKPDRETALPKAETPNSAVQADISEQDRSIMEEYFKGDVDRATYERGYEVFKRLGELGMDYDEAVAHAGAYASTLGKKYEPALRVANARGLKQRKALQAAQSTPDVQAEVHYGENAQENTPEVLQNVYTLLAKKTGQAVQVSDALSDGRGREANGAFSQKMGAFFFSTQAGNRYETVAHELFEYGRAYNPEGMARAEHAMLGMLAKKNGFANDTNGIDQLISAYQKRYGGTYADAAGEMVNDALSGTFSEDGGVEQLVRWMSEDGGYTEQEKKTVLQTLADWLKKLVDSLREYIASVGHGTAGAEAGARLQNAEQLRAQVLAELDKAVETRDTLAKKNAPASAEASDGGAVKYSLDGYSEHERENWAKSSRIVVYENDAQLERFIHDALDGKNLGQKMYFGKIPVNLAEKIYSETGLDVSGYNSTLRASEVKKILQYSHGDEATEIKRGQRAITIDDLKSIPQIIQSPDKIELDTQQYEGKPVIRFVKTLNGRTTVVTYVSKKHHDLTVQTMYAGAKKETPSPAANAPQSGPTPHTSETNRGTVSSINSIPQPGENATDDSAKFSRPVMTEQQIQEQLSAVREEKRELRREKNEWEESAETQRVLAERAEKLKELGVFGLSKWKKESAGWQEYEQERQAFKERAVQLQQREDTLAEQAKKYADEREQQAWTDAQARQSEYDRAVRDSGMTPEDYHRDTAVSQFGTTERFEAAGYILPDGQMLDFSDGGAKRAKDHREVISVFGPAELGQNADGTTALNRFIAEGNVRVMAESPGVDVSGIVQPSAEQMQQIRKMADSLGADAHRFNLDVSGEDGSTLASKWYEGNVRGSRIVNDLREFYKTGALPDNSMVADFHFSLPGVETSSEEARRLAWENQQLAQQVEALKDEFKLTEGHRVSDRAIDLVAGRMLRETKSGYDRSALNGQLRGLFDYIANGENVVWDDVMDVAAGIARGVLSKSSEMDDTLYNEYKDMRDYFRTTKILVTENVRAEIEATYGSYETFRRANFGRMALSTEDGTPLDALWGEISEKWPGMFDADTNELEQVFKVEEALDMVRPSYVNPYGLDMDGAAYELAQRMYEWYFTLPEVHTFADKQREKLVKTRIRMAEQRKTALEKQKARYEGRIRELREANAAQRKKASERMIRQRAAMMQSKREQALARRESVARTKYISRIKNIVWDLTKRLERPTDKKNIPEELREPVLRFLNRIDFNTSKEGTQASEKWKSAMSRMALMLKGAGENDSALDGYEVDPDLVQAITNLVKSTDGIRILSDMTADQLSDLDFVVRGIKRMILQHGKLLANKKYEEIEMLARASMQELESLRKKRGDYGGTERAIDMLNVDMLNPMDYFVRMGDAGRSIWDELRSGFDKRVWHLKDASDFMEKTLGDISVREWTGRRAETKEFDVGAGKIKLTVGQIMELYALDKREQARGHIYGAGIRVEDVRAGGVKRFAQAAKNKFAKDELADRIIQLTPQEVGKITSSLTVEQRDIADAMRGYLSSTVAAWGNEVSMQQFGYRKFTEKEYWPIRSDKNYTKTSDQTENNASLYAVKNLGATKPTQKGATNPVLIGDAFDTFTRHVADMATYNAWAIPLGDAMKWYNYKGENNKTGALKESLERAYGKRAVAYFTNLIADLNGAKGGNYGTAFEGLSGKMFSNYKAAAVGANLRVALQQPTAYLRAAAILDMKYLAKGVLHPLDGAKRAKEHSAITVWKDWGYFDTMIGKNMKQIIVGDETLTERVRSKSMILAEKGDEITWGALWIACEEYVKDNRPNLNPKSGDFNRAVADKFDEVIDRTQVVDTPLHRNQLLRSSNMFVKLETAFMAEPTKTYNLLRSAVADRLQGKPGAGKALGRTLGAFVLSAVATAAAAGIPDMLRDDDDEKTLEEKYMQALADNFKDNINLLNSIPFVKSVKSMLDGYDVKRTDLDGIASLLRAAEDLCKLRDGSTKKNAWQIMYGIAKGFSQVTGIPMSSAMREIRSLYDLFTAQSDPLRLYESINLAPKDMRRALARGDVERANEIADELFNEKVEEGMAKGKDEKEAQSYARSALKSSLTTEYKDAYIAGDSAERADIMERLTGMRVNGKALYDSEDIRKWLD